MTARCVAVAYSGGRDSSALLHATLHQALLFDVQVIALHVHHGISANADDWLAHCERQCRRWSQRGLPVEFASHRLVGSPSKGDSVEDWARKQRYQALCRMALEREASIVLLAHHRRDQAETFLLQALRGAGVSGLSGMPQQIERDGITWRRPWLRKSRAAIEAYVRRHRIRFVTDESNADSRFARSRLRVCVWDHLEGSFADAETTLATAAEWASEADAALRELAALDLTRIANAQGLMVAAWLSLSPPRRANALRSWIQSCQGGPIPASLTIRLLRELPEAHSARWHLGDGELRLYRGVLRYELSLPASQGLVPRESFLSARKSGTYPLPGWNGALRIERVRRDGVSLACVMNLELRQRTGGENFQTSADRPARSLKKQYQEAEVAAWHRTGPLVYFDGRLVFVPGLGLDARAVSGSGQSLFALHWTVSEDTL